MTTTAAPPLLCRFGHEMHHDGRQARCRTCNEAGARHARRGRHPREVLVKVPNAPLRERFVEMRDRGECSAVGIAAALGWMRSSSPAMRRKGKHDGGPDTGRLMKALGLQESSDRDGRYRRQHIAYEMAVRIGALLGMDPHEGGF